MESPPQVLDSALPNRREFLQSSAAVGAGLLMASSVAAQTKAPTTAPAPISAETSKNVRTVAILIYEGVELLDFAGPAEVFIVADEARAFRVFTVAEKDQLIKTNGKVGLMPEYTCENAPRADILVLPGGATGNVGKVGRAWLKKAADEAEIVMSVCAGAFLLAGAGLLDGISATTHHFLFSKLEKAAPKCKVVKDRRFVDSGKIITTAGVAAGIDGALHVVQRLLGQEAARWTAEEWIEYPWAKPSPTTQENRS